MGLKYQYALYIVLLHALMAVMAFYLMEGDKWLFLLAEVGLMVSLFIAYVMYQSLIQPLQLMKSGVSAIQDGDFNVRFLETKSSDINGLIAVYNSMLDKLREEGLKTQEQAYFLENLIKASPVGIILMDYDGNIAEINSKAQKLLACHHLQKPVKLEEIEHPVISEIIKLKIGENAILTYDGLHRYKCQLNQLMHRGFHRRYVLIEELSEELLKNEKAAYGKVIRMMAHEVNNSMGAVNSILQSVADFAFEDGDNEYVEALLIAKTRNEELAYFMKRFADVIRLPMPVTMIANLYELVASVMDLMRKAAEEGHINMVLDYDDKDNLISCDPAQIKQVLVNILKNAIESIGKYGQIKVCLSKNPPHIAIKDNGPGISEQARGMLFTPFFSTKSKGQGIGLIITRDILINHGATFSLATDKTSGWTTFSIGFKEDNKTVSADSPQIVKPPVG